MKPNVHVPVNTPMAVRNPKPALASRTPNTPPASTTTVTKSFQFRAPFTPPRVPVQQSKSSKETSYEEEIVIPVSKEKIAVAGPSGHPKELVIEPDVKIETEQPVVTHTRTDRKGDDGRTPEEMVNLLPVKTRERFYKTPTLGPYLKILMMLAKKTRQSPERVVERFLKEYDSLVKNQPRMANILAYQKIKDS
jgi:hypothetical protein